MAKRKNAELERLRADLRYWQGRTRLDAWSLKGSRRKCKEIGEKMRQIQKGK